MALASPDAPPTAFLASKLRTMATSTHASYRGAQAAWHWMGCSPEFQSLDAWSLEVVRWIGCSPENG
eukprot:1145488-Pyramimonas_sp.AAC.1